MGLHARSFFGIMADSAGQSINALSKSATFDTSWYSFAGVHRMGIAVKTGTVTGTSPTLDIDFEWTPDAGTSIFPIMVDGANSTTQADIAQITASDALTMIWHEVAYPQEAQFRLECTIGGTSPVFPLTIWMYGIA